METTLIIILCTLLGFILALAGLTLWKNVSKDKKKSKPKKKKIPLEFSKKILIASYTIAIVVILYTMYIIHLMVMGQYMGDPSSLNTLIMLTLGELGVANSFYFAKARSENLLKIRGSLGEEAAEFTRKALKKDDEY